MVLVPTCFEGNPIMSPEEADGSPPQSLVWMLLLMPSHIYQTDRKRLIIYITEMSEREGKASQTSPK